MPVHYHACLVVIDACRPMHPGHHLMGPRLARLARSKIFRGFKSGSSLRQRVDGTRPENVRPRNASLPAVALPDA